MLTTDGLTDHVSDDQIVEILRYTSTAKQACVDLIELANRSGGSDNITAVVARFQPKDEVMRLERDEMETDFECLPGPERASCGSGDPSCLNFS